MNIFISNLDQKVTGEDLKSLFNKYGAVGSAEVVMDAFTDQSRGFAYVEMPDDTEAQKAISELNNFQLDNRVLSVQEAKPKAEQKGSYPVRNGIQNNYGFEMKNEVRKKKRLKRRY